MSWRESKQYGLTIHRLLNRFDKRFGLGLDICWVVREGSQAVPEYALPPGYTMHEITSAQAPRMTGMTKKLTEDEVHRRLDAGHHGMIVVAPDDTVAGFTWANPHMAHDEHRCYELSPDEAYLYDTHVMPEHRGNQLASRIRAACYEQMRSKGYTSFISISDRYNLPSVKFKQRLGARPERLYLKLTIRGREIFFRIVKSSYKRLPRVWH